MARSPERAKVLVVDDDPHFRAALIDLLSEDGFAVRVYGSPGEVPPLETLDGFALMITDYEMPGENGVVFADRFHAVHPGVPIVLLTGYGVAAIEGALRARGFIHHCNKVFAIDEFQVLLHRLADGGAGEPDCAREG